MPMPSLFRELAQVFNVATIIITREFIIRRIEMAAAIMMLSMISQ